MGSASYGIGPFDIENLRRKLVLPRVTCNPDSAVRGLVCKVAPLNLPRVLPYGAQVPLGDSPFIWKDRIVNKKLVALIAAVVVAVAVLPGIYPTQAVLVNPSLVLLLEPADEPLPYKNLKG